MWTCTVSVNLLIAVGLSSQTIHLIQSLSEHVNLYDLSEPLDGRRSVHTYITSVNRFMVSVCPCSILTLPLWTFSWVSVCPCSILTLPLWTVLWVSICTCSILTLPLWTVLWCRSVHVLYLHCLCEPFYGCRSVHVLYLHCLREPRDGCRFVHTYMASVNVLMGVGLSIPSI